MTADDLQARFAAELRRQLGMAGGSAQPGTSVVNVAAPAVNVAPRIVAEMPSLPQPLEVADVDRFAGSWRYRLEVKRDGNGYIQTADMVPTRCVSAEDIQNER
jgi:hypothetical protein